MDNQALYVPYGIKAEEEYFRRFGKKQLRHLAVGFAITLSISAALYIVFASISAFAFGFISGVAASIMATMKDDQTNLSVIDHIAIMARFAGAQKKYRYVYGFEWE
jgi:hypothetical protein